MSIIDEDIHMYILLNTLWNELFRNVFFASYFYKYYLF